MALYTHKKSVMGEIREHLFLKLSDKGLLSNEIVRVVKDALQIFEAEGPVSAPDMNTKLRRLGWQAQLMDEYILNLLIFLFEKGPDQSEFDLSE
ncbi:MAG: hypothetical protein AB1427_13800 [Thermodesulfobacteriota bacterium]